MLKVKKSIVPKNINSEVEEWQNDIKNSIKSFYLQKKKMMNYLRNMKKHFKH